MSATSSTNLSAAKGTHKGKIGVQVDAFIDLIDGFFSNTGKLSHLKGGRGVAQVITFSATPTFNYANGDVFKITLTSNVTSSTFTSTSAVLGSRASFVIVQDSGGAHTFAWPSNVKGGMTVDSTGSHVSIQEFVYDGTNWRATGAGLGAA